ncbi:MAG: DNA polymerase I [Calditrichaeota bacterium]|nr:MAG: DNA polymerase I [Calditrichota bacterium]
MSNIVFLKTNILNEATMAEKLFLIDGSALYYRSYFAFIRNPLINSKGENTSATFGFLNTLVRLIGDEQPHYMAVVFDTGEPTFRHELYEPYKATRERMPEEMRAQYPRLIDTLKKLNFVLLEKDGYEADDIIGTLAKQFGSPETDVFILSGDKDMAQLVNDHVFLYAMGKGNGAPEIMDKKDVFKKFGVHPGQIIDWLALMGDSSDNIPGVPKVGPKTATTLLRDYGSLENLYKHIDELKKSKVKENLIEYKEQAFISYRLATIKTDVPVQVTPEDLKIRLWDAKVAAAVTKELEFNRLGERMQRLVAHMEPETVYERHDAQTVDYRLIDTMDGIKELVEQLARQPLFVFDLETDSLDTLTARPAGIAISWREKQAVYIALDHLDCRLEVTNALEQLRPVFENPDIAKYGQNLKYDTAVLAQQGIHVKGVRFDSMIASYVLDPSNRQHGLDSLAEKWLEYEMIPIEKLIGKGKKQLTMNQLTASEVLPYAAEDADITLRVCRILEKKIEEAGLEELFYKLEMPLMEVLRGMELHGIRINRDLLQNISSRLAEKLEQLVREIHEEVGHSFNIGSPQQLGVALFDELKIHEALGARKPRKTKTGQYSTSEQTLERYAAHPVIARILEYRKLSKLKNTYLDALPALIHPKTGRIHTSFNQTVAATGRLSSTNPNLQNIPIRTELGREIRSAFIPSRGDYVLLSCDYSQVELRIMAHLSDDPGLIEGFMKDDDIHAITAAEIFNIPREEVTPDHRRKAKEINFGIMYGMNKYGLATRLHITPDEAEIYIAHYFARFPGIQLFMNRTIEQARRDGYVETMMKRRRFLPEIKSTNRNIREFAERTAVNTPIQGSAADLIKKAMIDVQRDIDTHARPAAMLLQVHDELVFEVSRDAVDEFAERVKTIMSEAIPLKVPLKVDSGVGENWLQAHE